MADREAYVDAVLKKSMALVLREVGFEGAYAGALNVLVDVTRKFVREIALTTAEQAETSGRTEANERDVCTAIERTVHVGPSELLEWKRRTLDGAEASSLHSAADLPIVSPAFCSRARSVPIGLRPTVRSTAAGLASSLLSPPPPPPLSGAVPGATQAAADSDSETHVPRHLPPMPRAQTATAKRMRLTPSQEFERAHRERLAAEAALVRLRRAKMSRRFPSTSSLSSSASSSTSSSQSASPFAGANSTTTTDWFGNRRTTSSPQSSLLSLAPTSYRLPPGLSLTSP